VLSRHLHICKEHENRNESKPTNSKKRLQIPKMHQDCKPNKPFCKGLENASVQKLHKTNNLMQGGQLATHRSSQKRYSNLQLVENCWIKYICTRNMIKPFLFWLLYGRILHSIRSYNPLLNAPSQSGPKPH